MYLYLILYMHCFLILLLFLFLYLLSLNNYLFLHSYDIVHHLVLLPMNMNHQPLLNESSNNFLSNSLDHNSIFLMLTNIAVLLIVNLLY